MVLSAQLLCTTPEVYPVFFIDVDSLARVDTKLLQLNLASALELLSWRGPAISCH